MPCVLLMEQDKIWADIYREHLEEAGFEVVHVTNGEEGIEKALELKPDAILLDIPLPKKNGFEVLDELQAHAETQSIPVAIHAVLGTREDVDRCLASGACDYLIKAHHSPEDVIACLKKMMGVRIGEPGFTLTELFVVITIIGVLGLLFWFQWSAWSGG